MATNYSAATAVWPRALIVLFKTLASRSQESAQSIDRHSSKLRPVDNLKSGGVKPSRMEASLADCL
jgi:hypothetical protein